MDLAILSNLRTSVRNALAVQYPETEIYTAEITSLIQDDDSNVGEFITVFFSDADETQVDELLDDEHYNTSSTLTVGYFHERAATDQGWLDAEAGTIRRAVMAFDGVFNGTKGDIDRAGWQYVPATEGATPGIYFRFSVSYSD
jgi:hypothetical protein